MIFQYKIFFNRQGGGFPGGGDDFLGNSPPPPPPPPPGEDFQGGGYPLTPVPLCILQVTHYTSFLSTQHGVIASFSLGRCTVQTDFCESLVSKCGLVSNLLLIHSLSYY